MEGTCAMCGLHDTAIVCKVDTCTNNDKQICKVCAEQFKGHCFACCPQELIESWWPRFWDGVFDIEWSDEQ